MPGDGQRVVAVVVPIHVGDLQFSFVDCGFKGHATPESLFERPEKGEFGTDVSGGTAACRRVPNHIRRRLTRDDTEHVRSLRGIADEGEVLPEKEGGPELTYAAADTACGCPAST